jgi:hypothetical protein
MANLAQPIMKPAQLSPQKRHRNGWRRLPLWLAGLFMLALALYILLIFPWISRWGATEEEVAAPLPGDEFITNPLMVTTKAITIHAPPAQVWRWLVQLGVDRGGMYSYLWVENWLLRLKVTNSTEIRAEWQEIKVGDFLRFTPKEYRLNPGPGLWVVSIEPEHALIGCFGLEDNVPDCNRSATWQFILQPVAEDSTRLILRSHTAGTPSLMATTAAKLGYAFQFYMEQKMLRTIRDLAEMPIAQ